mgnify:CR=1 FL=1
MVNMNNIVLVALIVVGVFLLVIILVILKNYVITPIYQKVSGQFKHRRLQKNLEKFDELFSESDIDKFNLKIAWFEQEISRKIEYSGKRGMEDCEQELNNIGESLRSKIEFKMGDLKNEYYRASEGDS